LLAVALLAGALATSCGDGTSKSPAATAPPVGGSPVEATAPATPLRRLEQPAAYVVNPDGTGLREIFPSGAYDYIDARPSPDGRTLAVLAQQFRDEPKQALVFVDVASGARRQVASGNAAATLQLGDWAPDGSRILVVARVMTAISPPGSETEYRVYAASFELERTIKGPEDRWLLGWGGEGHRSLIAWTYSLQGRPAAITAIDADDGSVRNIANAASITAAALSPDGRRVAYASTDGEDLAAVSSPEWTISVVDVREATVPRRIARPGDSPFGVFGLAWSPDGNEIAYGWATPRNDEAPRGIFIARTGMENTPRRVTVTDEFDVNPRWSPDGRWLLADRLTCVQCDGGGVRTVLAAADASHTDALPPGSGFYSSAAWSPDGARFVYGADALFVRDARDPVAAGAQIASLPASTYTGLMWVGERIFFVRRGTDADVVYSAPPDGGSADVLAVGFGIAASPGGKTARLLDGAIEITDARGTHSIEGDFLRGITYQRVPELTWSPDERHLALAVDGGDTGALLTFDLHDDGTWAPEVHSHAGIHGVRWSPDGATLAYVTRDGAYVAGSRGGPARELAAGLVSALDWSPDGQTIAIARGTQVSFAAADASGAAVRAAIDHGLANVVQLRWSPHGARIAVASYDGVAVVAVGDGRIATVRAHAISGVAWSPDGTQIAFGRDTCDVESCRQYLSTTNADGTGVRDVADALGRILTPLAWRADGRIVFSSVRAGI